jgi:8-oxo-dGTP pyrophosphatase MutT (NUDIX family)
MPDQLDEIAARVAYWRKHVDPSGDRNIPNLRPRDAATLILIDRTGSAPKVLLGRRHHGHKFMPGKFVFPGGRVEPDDRRIAVATPLHPAVEAKLMHRVRRPSGVHARSLALAAIRETFEETGLLIGRKAEVPTASEAGANVFEQAGVMPELAGVHFVARAITPPHRPRRFDTRFFAAEAETIAHRIEGVIHAEAELVELTWLAIREAQNLEMPAITRIVLDVLEQRIAGGFNPATSVPFFRMVHGRHTCELI